MTPSDHASILVVVAHPDDECIGAGGTIRKHVDQGFETDVLCLTGNEVRNAELKAACEVLGVREVYTNERDDFAIDWPLEQEIVSAILKSRPSVIITHSVKDYNRNHVRCSKLVADAVEWASHVTMYEDAVRVDRVYCMEINSLHSRPNVLVDVSNSFDAAMDALRKHSRSLRRLMASTHDSMMQEPVCVEFRLRAIELKPLRSRFLFTQDRSIEEMRSRV